MKTITAKPPATASVPYPSVPFERVAFASGEETLVGHLYFPPGYRAGDQLPAVVVTGAWMTVKEQMAGRYARELASRGYAALAFDFRGWGESGGRERQRENPAEKIEDIQAAVAFLATRSEVDPQRIAGLGICASAGYMVGAATRTPALRAVALVAPWLHDADIVRELYGGEEGVERLTRIGREAAASFQDTGEMTLVAAASLTDRSAIMFGVPYYTDADRGMIPQWRNEANLAFWEGWLTFDGIRAAPELRQPIRVVHSDAAAIPHGARRFLARVQAPRSELWLDGVSQFDFYDRPEPVRLSADAVAEHFRQTLDGRAVDMANRSASDGQTVVEEFFAALEAKDIDRFLAVWMEDGVQVMPFSPNGFPQRLEGREAIRAQYGALPENYRSMRFPREILPLQAPGLFVVRYTGEIELMSGGRYDNTYIGLFTVRDGRVAEFVEYFNPIVLQQAFGEALHQNFGVAGSR